MAHGHQIAGPHTIAVARRSLVRPKRKAPPKRGSPLSTRKAEIALCGLLVGLGGTKKEPRPKPGFMAPTDKGRVAGAAYHL